MIIKRIDFGAIISGMSNLSDWLVSELNDRGWSQRELGRRADVSQTQISNVINKSANPGADFCVSIARALGNPPENLLRMAGILPPLPPSVSDEDRALQLFRQLEPTARQFILVTMQALIEMGSSRQESLLSGTGTGLDSVETSADDLALRARPQAANGGTAPDAQASASGTEPHLEQVVRDFLRDLSTPQALHGLQYDALWDVAQTDEEKEMVARLLIAAAQRRKTEANPDPGRGIGSDSA
jgi:transcriptional regulator with XRE-family HTH domain